MEHAQTQSRPRVENPAPPHWMAPVTDDGTLERTQHLQQLVDQLEHQILHQGWPIPFSPFGVVHYEALLACVDDLRDALTLRARDPQVAQVFGVEPHSGQRKPVATLQTPTHSRAPLSAQSSAKPESVSSV